MFTKYKLQQIGFDVLDEDSSHGKVLDAVTPFGPSKVREAYACGIGLTLNINKEFEDYNSKLLEDHEMSVSKQSKLKIPHYLHIVIASEQ